MIVQQVESNLITPLIADRMVSIAPAVGLFAVVAMGVLFGPLGLLLGFPLAIVFDVAIRRLYVRDTLGRACGDHGQADDSRRQRLTSHARSRAQTMEAMAMLLSLLVEPRRIELLTSAVRLQRSPS